MAECEGQLTLALDFGIRIPVGKGEKGYWSSRCWGDVDDDPKSRELCHLIGEPPLGLCPQHHLAITGREL